MTLLIFILSLALSFVCSNMEECENIRKIEYVYQDYSEIATSTDAGANMDIDYVIIERLTFVDGNEGFSIVENLYTFPHLVDKNMHDWQMAITLLARERGVEIKEFNGNTATGYIPQATLDAYMDVFKDGYVNNMDSLDYLSERELNEQRTRYTVIYVSFSIFLSSAKMIRSCLRTFVKGRGV